MRRAAWILIYILRQKLRSTQKRMSASCVYKSKGTWRFLNVYGFSTAIIVTCPNKLRLSKRTSHVVFFPFAMLPDFTYVLCK